MTTDGPSLPQRDELREEVEKACLEGLIDTRHGWRYRPSKGADAVLNLLAARRDDLAEKHRDLVSRLGFGDNRTEPMADNDTIVAWFEERGREADEWRESQRWRDECYLAGHPEDEDCHEHDLNLIRDDLAEKVARVEAVEQQFRDVADDLRKPSNHWGNEDDDRIADLWVLAADQLRAALTSDRAATEGES